MQLEGLAIRMFDTMMDQQDSDCNCKSILVTSNVRSLELFLLADGLDGNELAHLP